MKKTTTKMLYLGLVMGCVSAMGLFSTSSAHATESQSTDSSVLNTLIGVLNYPCGPNVSCPPPGP